MSGPGCAEKVKKSLNDVGSVDIDVEKGRVVVNSNLPWAEIQEKIEQTGRRAVLAGFGGNATYLLHEKFFKVLSLFLLQLFFFT